MTYRKSQDTYTKIYWIFTACMLLTAIPLGIILILVKLMERRKKRRAAIFQPVPDAPYGSQTTRRIDSRSPQELLTTAAEQMHRRIRTGLVLIIISAVLLAFFLLNSINPWTPGCCLFASAFYMFMGLQSLSSIKRFKEYAAAMSSRPAVAVAELSAATGLSEKQIRADIERLAFMELFPRAFLDRERNLVFCF